MSAAEASWLIGSYAHATPSSPSWGPASAPGPQFILMKMVHANGSESSCLSGRAASVLRRRLLQKNQDPSVFKIDGECRVLGDTHHPPPPGTVGRFRGLASGPGMLRDWW